MKLPPKPPRADPAQAGTRARARIRSFSRSLPMSLLVAREAALGRFRPALHRHGITEQQWRVLRILASTDAAEVTELAGIACLLAPSLSRILKDLEGRGLVSRHAVPGDARRAMVSLAPDGLALVETASRDFDAAYARIANAFGHDRVEELRRLLAELSDTIDALPTAD